MYAESLNDPAGFWAAQAEEFVTWNKKWDQVLSGSISTGDCKWFPGAELNVSYNCIDRHVVSGHGDTVAFHWEGNDGDTQTITYEKLLDEVCRLANMFRARGVKKGERVCIYMPMIPEAVYAMLACARIGAVHTVVFGGFSAEALQSRILDAGCSFVITANFGKRGDKIIPLYERVQEIVSQCPSLHTVCVVNNSEIALPDDDLTIDYRKAVSSLDTFCEPERMEAEDPLFILYTSGSTGKPKGVLHSTGGYLLYAAMTFRYNFSYTSEDVYWCTADIGWITGHSYVVYGPLCNRATSVMFEGVPTYPNASRYWDIVDKYKVTTLYSTPTTIRMLMAQGDAYVTSTSRKSLSILGTVGEPINPEAWRWYHDIVGRQQCFITDTWWQTETGGHAIAPMPGVGSPKPGAAMMPFFGIEPVIVDLKGAPIHNTDEGILLLRGSWPGQMRDLYGDHERFLNVYTRPYPGFFYTGDGARRDEDGAVWITGRIDDTMNIAGRLIGTAEVEGVLATHPAVAEAAVVAIEHPVTGYYMHAFVCLKHSESPSAPLRETLKTTVGSAIGSFAKPSKISFVPALPKTRSGKIMRRILRKIVVGDIASIGDVTTLADPEVIGLLVESLETSQS